VQELVKGRPGAKEIPRKAPLEKAPLKKVPLEEVPLKDLTQNPRYETLSRDPQTGKRDAKSEGEAISILKAEREGSVQNPRRPDLAKGEPNLDYNLDGTEPYKWADATQPVKPDSKPNSLLEKQHSGIGESIHKQKAGAKDVLHVVALKNIPLNQRSFLNRKY
jgi:hypothetical protein